MTLWQVALLGVVQGLTEFLPISSDGHLAVFQSFLPRVASPLALDVALHVGTLLAMLVFFYQDLFRLGRGVFSTQEVERQGARADLRWVAVVTLVTGGVGLGLKHVVEGVTTSLFWAGVGFALTTVWLLVGVWAGRRVASGLRRGDGAACVMGLVQGAAVWPGLSRSGSTIGLALLLGWDWERAGRMSFIMAIPAIFGATLLEARDISQLPLGMVGVGIAVSFVTGLMALGVLMKFLRARKLWPFAAYTGLMTLFCFFH